MKTLALSGNGIHTGSLILVNAQYPYDESKTEHALITVQNNTSILMECRAVALLSKLMEGISGWSRISAVSGWRSLQEQQNIWNQSLTENGTEFTKKFVAEPGHSEHHTGLAIDLGLKKPNIDFICPEFPYNGICQTFREKAALFGFVERYPKGKETITGISHEPWHFRYVGVPHAAIMTEHHFTLEEYLEFVKQFPYGVQNYEYQRDGVNVAVSFLHVSRGACKQIELDSQTLYSVSGNNVDGFIMTEWRRKNEHKKELWGA